MRWMLWLFGEWDGLSRSFSWLGVVAADDNEMNPKEGPGIIPGG